MVLGSSPTTQHAVWVVLAVMVQAGCNCAHVLLLPLTQAVSSTLDQPLAGAVVGWVTVTLPDVWLTLSLSTATVGALS